MPNGCLRAVSVLALIAGGAMLFVRCACMQEMSGDGPLPPESKGPWAVNGIRIGATEAECRTILGDDAEPLRGRIGTTTLRWGNRGGRDVSVTFDANGAADVLGDTLTDLAGNAVVGTGTSLEDVRAILPDADEREQTRPTGSGVISISRTYVGTTFEWTDATARYSIGFSTEGLGWVRAERPGAR